MARGEFISRVQYVSVESGHDPSDLNRDPDSGGTTVFIAPGIQYVTRRWIIEAAVQLPVVQDLNGDALELDYIARGGFRFNF